MAYYSRSPNSIITRNTDMVLSPEQQHLLEVKTGTSHQTGQLLQGRHQPRDNSLQIHNDTTIYIITVCRYTLIQ